MDQRSLRVTCLVAVLLKGPPAASQNSPGAKSYRSIYVVAVRAPGDATLFQPCRPPIGSGGSSSSRSGFQAVRPPLAFPGPELVPAAASPRIGGIPDAVLKTAIEHRLQKDKRYVLAPSVETADLIFFVQGLAITEFVTEMPATRANTRNSVYISIRADEPANVLINVTAIAVPAGAYLRDGGSGMTLLEAALWQGLATGVNGGPAPVDGIVDGFLKDFRGAKVSRVAQVVAKQEDRRPLPPAPLQTVMPPSWEDSARGSRVLQPENPPVQQNPRGPEGIVADSLCAVPQPAIAGPLELSGVAPESAPLRLALIIDTSASMRPNFASLKVAASAFVDALRADDQVMVVSFDSRAYLACGLTSDRSSLHQALDRMRAAGSNSRLYDTLVATAERFGPVAGHKAIVLLTDGLDVGSGLADSAGTLARFEGAMTPVYIVQYNTTQQGLISPPPGAITRRVPDGTLDKAARFGWAADYLQKLTQASGGRYQRADSADDVAAGFSRIAEELRRQ